MLNVFSAPSASGVDAANLAMKELIIEASLANLNEVIDFINGELAHGGCPPELQTQIDLAVEEIFVNIVNYAYQPASGSVCIGIAVGEEAVIRIEDTGEPYNPLERSDPDLDKPLMERDIGGLGIFLVKKMMDKVDYIRIDNKNVLVMTKKISH